MERRKFPRVCETIPCQIGLGTSSLPAVTQNISCAGALCVLSQSIPLMTKLDIALMLPAVSSALSPERIHCVGVVVRVESAIDPGGERSFLIAIYFSEISPENRRRIAEFVLNSMLSHDRRRS